MKNFLLTLVLLSIICGSCREEDFIPDTFGSTFGEVLEEGTNVAIVEASISTTPPTSVVQSDVFGRFSLENIKTGTYSLRVEKAGFVTKVANISVTDDNTTSVVINLESDSLTNSAPSAPSMPSPADNSEDISTSIELSWEATDSDGDNLTYDIVLFNADQSQSSIIEEGTSDTSYSLTSLDYGTTYFWQIIVHDGTADPVNGDLWSFETLPFPNHRFLFARATDGKYDIYSANEQTEAIQLTDNAGNNWRPRMSPQRDKIAFLSNLGLETHIYLMNRDGSEVEKVTSIPVSGNNIFDLDFSWSPDGQYLLYMNGNRLYQVNRDGTGTTQFAKAPTGFTYAECDWTLVDDRIMARIVGLNIYNSITYLYQSDGNVLQTLLNDLPGSTGGAMFSVDGKDMLYTLDVSGHEVPEGRQLDARIFVRGLNSSVPTDLSINKQAGTNDLDPRYSPDGAWVIFVNTNNDDISQKNIYKVNLAGTERTLLFENAEMPDWR